MAPRTASDRIVHVMKNDDAPDAAPIPLPVPPAPPLDPAGPGFRLRAARAVLATAAGCLLVIALLHASGYFFAKVPTEYSGVKSEYHAVFRGLRLGSAVQALIVAVILGLAAVRPNAVSSPVIVLCGLLPLVGTAMVAWSTSNAVGSILLAVTALLVVAGALLRPSDSEG